MKHFRSVIGYTLAALLVMQGGQLVDAQQRPRDRRTAANHSPAHRPPTHGHKLDRALAAALATNSSGTQRVIIRTEAGAEDQTAGALRRKGRKVRGTHRLIGAIAADVTSDDLSELVVDPRVVGVSLDAPMHTQQAVATSGQVLYQT